MRLLDKVITLRTAFVVGVLLVVAGVAACGGGDSGGESAIDAAFARTAYLRETVQPLNLTGDDFSEVFSGGGIEFRRVDGFRVSLAYPDEEVTSIQNPGKYVEAGLITAYWDEIRPNPDSRFEEFIISYSAVAVYGTEAEASKGLLLGPQLYVAIPPITRNDVALMFDQNLQTPHAAMDGIRLDTTFDGPGLWVMASIQVDRFVGTGIVWFRMNLPDYEETMLDLLERFRERLETGGDFEIDLSRLE